MSSEKKEKKEKKLKEMVDSYTLIKKENSGVRIKRKMAKPTTKKNKKEKS